MVPLLVVIALAIAFGGLLLSTQATAGVYLALMACLFAILARMRQAHEQHERRVRPIASQPVADPASPKIPEPPPQPMSLRMRLSSAGLIALALVSSAAMGLSDELAKARIADRYTDAIREAEQRSATEPLPGIRVRVTATRTEDRWAITDVSAVTWLKCVASIANSEADIPVFYPAGTVTIERELWRPSPPGGDQSEVAASCATQAPE